MKSLAVVNFSSKPGSVELQEIEYPLFGDDDVIMQVEAVSVCGSDLHQWHGTNSWEVNYPVVLGHEFCGLYGPDVQFTEAEKSRVFIKVTKTKTLAAYGQIVDVLFSNNNFPISLVS